MLAESSVEIYNAKLPENGSRLTPDHESRLAAFPSMRGVSPSRIKG